MHGCGGRLVVHGKKMMQGPLGLGLDGGQLEEGKRPFLILQTNTHYSVLANKL